MSAPNGNGAGTAILAEIKALNAKLDALMKHFGLGANGQPASGAAGANVATLAQIQGEHGNPEIGRMPKNWHGPSFEGLRASECAPDFLDWKADNPREGKEKYAKYDRLNGARCRRWAVEIREGRHKPRTRQPAAPPPGETTWSRGNAPPMHDAMEPPPDDLPPPPDDWNDAGATF